MNDDATGMTRMKAVERILEQIDDAFPGAIIEHRTLPGDAEEVEVRGHDEDSFLSIIMSSHETVITAGVRARFELPLVEEDVTECLAIVRAILSGALLELAGARGSTFELHLQHGKKLHGSVREGLLPAWGETRRRVVPFSTFDRPATGTMSE